MSVFWDFKTALMWIFFIFFYLATFAQNFLAALLGWVKSGFCGLEFESESCKTKKPEPESLFESETGLKPIPDCRKLQFGYQEMDAGRQSSSSDEISPQIRRHRQDHLLCKRFQTTRDLHFGGKLSPDLGLAKQCWYHEEHNCVLHQEQDVWSPSHVLSGK